MQLVRLVFKDRSIWFKLTLLTVLPAVIAAAVIVFPVMAAVERAIITEAVGTADALTGSIGLSLSNALDVNNKQFLDHFVDALGRMHNVNYAMVVDSGKRRILAHNDHRMDGKSTDSLPAPMSVEPSAAKGRSRQIHAITENCYAASAPLTIEDKSFGFLYIGFSLDQERGQMVLYKRRVVIVALLVVCIGSAMALITARLISAPIRVLADQAKKLADNGERDLSLTYESKDEIGRLADSFNRMLGNFKIKQGQLTAVNTIADAVYRSLDTQTVARHAVQAMMEYSQSPAVAVFSLNASLQQLELIHAQGFDRQTLDVSAVLPLEGSLTGIAVREKQVVSTVDLGTDMRLVPEVRKALSEQSLKSVLSIPLLARDQVLGAMNMIYKGQYAISASEKKTLLSIGKTVGLAMANARQVMRIQKEIDERLEAEKALRASENQYRNLVERANDGIIIIQNGLIRFANPSLLAMSGQAATEVIDQPFTVYLHPEEKEKVARLYEQRMAEDVPDRIYETIFVRKDGRKIYAEVNAGRITYQGKPADMVIIRDITERKRAQDALQHAHDLLERKVARRTAELAVAKERAEESDRLKSAFLASMSHELRTPLNSIIGFTGIILQELVGPLNHEQSKQLTMVQNSAHHLLGLINDVLDISKIEAGQLAVASESFAMQACVNKVEQTISPMAQQKKVEISVKMPSDAIILTSDRRRVEQILLNLMNNAVKFTDRGRVQLTCEADSKWVTATVADTGIGIAPADMPKLFSAFHQIETGLSRRYEGTGLGLSICKRLVELLGGKIQAHSEGLGKGATFSFSLPTGEHQG